MILLEKYSCLQCIYKCIQQSCTYVYRHKDTTVYINICIKADVTQGQFLSGLVGMGFMAYQPL